MYSPEAGLASLTPSEHPPGKDGTGNWEGGPETLRSGPRGREHGKKLPSSPPGDQASPGGLREGRRETHLQDCSCSTKGPLRGCGRRL